MARAITLRAPVIMMILAATAIPIELRPFGQASLDLTFDAEDFVENVLGYVPVGIVLAGLGPLWAVAAATFMSLFAETGQFVMMHRDPSVADVVANVMGGILGTAISSRFKIASPALSISRSRALMAAMVALAVVFRVWATSGVPVSVRGATSPGILEAHWKLDETGGRVVLDSSGHGLSGRFKGEPKRVAGVTGGAVRLDGVKDYIDFGHSTALRLAGSMTISAWINPSSFPADDAAIVSTHNGLGYQLDTTVDKGPRTIGFKLADACGQLMARYGATPLAVNTWYHVAGVYDSEARTMNVYLNGKLDNGVQVGSVTGTQVSSREAVSVGRRSDHKGFEFAGSIGDVRIYSMALTQAEVVAVMQGRAFDPAGGSRGAKHPGEKAPACAMLTDSEDGRIPGYAAVFGALAAIACLGLWPASGPAGCLAVSLVAGFLFVPAMASNPLSERWLMVLVSMLGGASVAVSIRQQNDPPL